MECVAGETLAARLKRGPMAPGEAVDIAIQIAEGLNAAHARGVLHRDLKPANIMITPAGEVKIMDFGLAKLAEIAPVTNGETVPMTAPGQVMGTPEYLAPEQIRGEPADGRADIWAFGVTLYEMLTGARPFRSTPTRSIVRSILEDAPPSPSSVRPGAPKGLDAIVRKAMAKDADERYQSAGELLDDLRRWKAGRGRRRGPWLAVAAAIGRDRDCGRGAVVRLAVPARQRRVQARNDRRSSRLPRSLTLRRGRRCRATGRCSRSFAGRVLSFPPARCT